MAVFLISGDESLIGAELDTLIGQLVGDGDRSMMVDDFDCSESSFVVGAVVDALLTMSLFLEKKVVLVRHLHDIDADAIESFVAGLDSHIPEVDVVMTATGRIPKAISDACKRVSAQTIGATVVSGQKDRVLWVETRLVEAGFTYSADVARMIAAWFANDHARLSGLIATLVSAHGHGAKLTRSDVEAFLGEAGAVAPWDLTDAIDAGDAAKALTMLHRMMIDSHPMQILSLLGNRYAQMMKIDGRGVRTKEDAVAILGGKPFTAGKVLEQHQRLGSAGIARAVSLLAEADRDLRGGKDWSEEMVMEVLVARLARLGSTTRQRVTSRR